jgi:hypothetical protein
MSQKDRNELYLEFQNGDIPNENDFADTIDSALNLVDDGLYPYKIVTPTGTAKNIGIGDTAPLATLGLKGQAEQDDRMISFTSLDETQKWNINLNPTGNDVDGFSIDDATSGIGSSRFFIDHVSQGNIGIGTVTPQAKLHVSGANDGGNVSIMVENLESGTEGGYLLSALDDNAVPERMKTLAVHEKIGSELSERITVLGTHGAPGLPIVNVGINEVMPYATLHVTKPASDPTEPVNLAENTGILCLGQIDDDNLAMDSKQIQARHGDYVGGTSTLSFTASELFLQPYGGGLVVNAATGNPANYVTVVSDGKTGIGTTPVNEKLEVNGAILVGNTNTVAPQNGTVRWSPADKDLEVWVDTAWKSLTTHVNTDGLWTAGGAGLIYYNPAGQHPKVGIGLAQPTAMLHVKETNTEVVGNSGAVAVVNQAATIIDDPTHTRVGLAINCSGVWSPNADALNIGLYVLSATGQTAAKSNIGALINGNTVVGNITGNSIIGDDGVNVLAIQNGAVPTSTPGTTETTGIQIYSANVGATAGTPGFSAFHLMTGDGAIMKLYRQPDMTASDINAPNTGNAVTDAVINNMRTRIDQLEAILKALGILTP